MLPYKQKNFSIYIHIYVYTYKKNTHTSVDKDKDISMSICMFLNFLMYFIVSIFLRFLQIGIQFYIAYCMFDFDRVIDNVSFIYFCLLSIFCCAVNNIEK